ncbi:MAG: DNA translocase FtsK 4TM domain-containing protein [Desulfopila sp.]|jgi:S-DNA-T family DNA segregation ATPase FtsK/SpoIIIE|nr:DNA translocase FtsK 4TM domain-containing protein [Desulfopila sp.]
MAQANGASRPSLRQELVAVLGIFLSIFLFLSLFSHSIATGGNWCGEIGQLIAQFLLGFTGWGAYMLAFLVLLLSLLFFSPNMSFERLPQVTLGITCAVISFCALLSSLSLYQQSFIDTGGFLGKYVFSLMSAIVGGPGTVLTLALLFLISLMLSTQFSPYSLFALVWRLVRGFFRFLFSLIFRRRNKAGVAQRARTKGKSEVPEQRHLEKPGVTPVPEPLLKEPVSSTGEDTEGDFSLAPVARGDWKIPPLSLLNKNEQVKKEVDKETYYKISKKLEQKLKNFGVSGSVVGISPGPVVTTYEYSPAPGIKINKIAGLADDLALGLKAQSVRVVGSIPGKAALGIEIPNDDRQIVYIRDLLASDVYRQSNSKLTIALGLDVVGNTALADLSKMPHLLIAGATGAGKSVAINTIIASILFNATPEEVRILMVDPKRIELSGYEGIPHLLHPVVVEPKLASRALLWAVREMERRYRMLEEAKVKSFHSYNETAVEKMPYIVIIVDELADLMMVASKDVEGAIARLAQMARAAGIHLILATQRPSVDVLTGLIKANFPTRLSFKVSSKVDSRTILDTSGAEHLLGAGDMLYLPPGSSALKRIHGAYISEKETAALIDFWKKQGAAAYDESVIEEVEGGGENDAAGGDEDHDDRYDEAVAVVCEAGGASISMIQRRLRIGYNRAARMIERMEREGIVGPADGSKPREVLVRQNYD